jgi:hypothetical protein
MSVDNEYNEQSSINEDWLEYYKVLEGIRRTGYCNMWGASPYLKACCPELSEKESDDILISWIKNYDELNERFGWQK